MIMDNPLRAILAAPCPQVQGQLSSKDDCSSYSLTNRVSSARGAIWQVRFRVSVGRIPNWRCNMARKQRTHWHAALCGLALIALAGCASNRDLVGEGVETNVAAGQIENQLLLLNIIRADYRHPLLFTSIDKISGNPSVNQSIAGLTIPFGRGTTNPFQLTGSGQRNAASMDVVVMDKQEFARGITAPIAPITFAYLVDQGWSIDLLFHLLIARVDGARESYVNDPLGTDYARFSALVSGLSKCRVSVTHNKVPLAYFAEVPFKDATSVPREFTLDMLSTSLQSDSPLVGAAESGGKHSTPPAAPVPKAGASPASPAKDGDAVPPSPAYRYQLSRDDIRLKLTSREGKGADTCQGGVGADAIVANLFPQDGKKPELSLGADAVGPKLQLRSPEATLYYLGQIVRKELGDPWTNVVASGSNELSQNIPRVYEPAYPEVCNEPDRHNSSVPLFRVHVGKPPTSARAVSVKYEGEEYWVATHNTKGECDAAQSMHVLSLLQMLIDLQKSATEIPTTGTVRVVP
jgi:hypothetical protein